MDERQKVKSLLILASSSPRMVLKPEALKEAGYDVERFSSVTSILGSQKLYHSCLVIVEIGGLEDVENARTFLEATESFSVNELRTIIYSIVRVKNIREKFSHFSVSDYVDGPVPERTVAFKLGLQQKLLIPSESGKGSEEEFHIHAISRETDGTLVMKGRGPAPHTGKWLLEQHAPQSKIRWRWIKKSGDEKENDEKFAVFTGDQIPRYEDADQTWLFTGKDPILETHAGKKITFFFSKNSPSMKRIQGDLGQESRIGELVLDAIVVEKKDAKALPSISLEENPTEKKEDKKPIEKKEEDPELRIFSIEKDSPLAISLAKKEGELKHEAIFGEDSCKKNLEIPLEKPGSMPGKEQFSPPVGVRESNVKTAPLSTEGDEKEKSQLKSEIEKKTSSPISSTFASTASEAPSEKKEKSLPAEESAGAKIPKDSATPKKNITQAESLEESFKEKNRLERFQEERTESGQGVSADAAAIEERKREELQIQLSAEKGSLKNSVAAQSVESKGKDIPDERYASKGSAAGEMVRGQPDQDVAHPISPEDQIKEDEILVSPSSPKAEKAIDSSSPVEKIQTESTSGGTSNLTSSGTISKPTESARTNRNLSISEKDVPSEQQNSHPAFSSGRRYFLKTLTELHDRNSTWERADIYRIYIAGEHKYYGIKSIEDIFPLWIYSGESAPEFIESKQSWLFYDQPPFEVRTQSDLPQAVSAFLITLLFKNSGQAANLIESMERKSKQSASSTVAATKRANASAPNPESSASQDSRSFLRQQLNQTRDVAVKISSPIVRAVVKFLNWLGL